jgi:hypothetical protein
LEVFGIRSDAVFAELLLGFRLKGGEQGFDVGIGM